MLFNKFVDQNVQDLLVWIEDIANDIGAIFKDYAVSLHFHLLRSYLALCTEAFLDSQVASSVTSLKIWPTAEVDFLSQLDIFYSESMFFESQSNFTNRNPSPRSKQYPQS